jgi:hypothetical protein
LESFYQVCSIIGEDLEEILDLLLSRYSGNIDYVLSLELDAAVRLIKKAKEKSVEEQIWDLYVSKSILAGKDMPSFDEIMKKAKEQSSIVVTSFDEAEKMADEAYKRLSKKK